MVNDNIWKEYKKIILLSSNKYSSVYKSKNMKTGNYVVIKEINKQLYKKYFNYDIHLLSNKINNEENEVLIKNVYETKKYIYIIMELCLCNLKEYLKMRENLSKEEIKIILSELNKYINKHKINYKLSNIFYFFKSYK